MVIVLSCEGWADLRRTQSSEEREDCHNEKVQEVLVENVPKNRKGQNRVQDD